MLQPHHRSAYALHVAAVLATAIVILVTLHPTSASVTVNCGDTITASTQLTHDLLNCPADGLIIGADDVVLDLTGHTVDGVGLGVGIRNDGYREVTIKNGTIQEFDYGIQLNPGTEKNTIERLTLTLNQDAALQLSSTHGNKICHNMITKHAEQGIVLLGSNGNFVSNNTIEWSQGISLMLTESGSNRIQNNVLSNGSDRAVVVTASSNNVFLENTLSAMGDTGLSLEAGSTENRVEGNTFTQTGDTGLLLSGSSWNTVMSNTFEQTGDTGVLLDGGSNSNIVNRNTFTQTGDSGVSVVDSNDNWFALNTAVEPGDAGLKFTRSHQNQIRHNTVRGASDCAIFLELSNGNTVQDNNLAANLDAPQPEKANTCGIDLAQSDGNVIQSNNASNMLSMGIYLEGSSDNDIVANIASGNKADGIYVVGQGEIGAPNVIDGNIASHNLGNGIEIASGGHSISNNTAKSNDGWGVYTAPGNTDGGGNFANGNHEPSQCFGIVCFEAPLNCGSTVAVSADADSWIAEDNVNSNFGTDSVLKVRSKSPTNNFRALVRFRLPPMPVGCSVFEAKLQLYAPSATTGRTIEALQVVFDWTESSVTWATQPTTAGLPATTDSGLGTLEWGVTSQVQSMYSGNYGFLIRDKDDGEVASNEQSFHGREKGLDHPPALVITFQ